MDIEKLKNHPNFYHGTNNGVLLCGDCLEIMPRLEPVDLVVTSPPYDNLRDYKGYNFDFKGIAKELFKKTKQGGVVVWVVGDATIHGSETGTSFRHALYFKELGFNLHDTMIYEKNGAAYPASDKSNRYSQVFEYMFVFSKLKPKTVNLIQDKKNNWAGFGSFGQTSGRQVSGGLKKRGRFVVREYSYRNNIWKINNGFGYGSRDNIAYEHPATFPDALAGDHILTWSDKKNIIMDPMCGSGTVAIMCERYNRRWIGIEISLDYCRIAKERIIRETSQLKLF